MSTRKCKENGFTLLEVVIGIVIFALGIMALAQLQGNLSKASSDSNARSVATNLAEENMEAVRSFSQITAGPDVNAFNNIINKTEYTNRGGIAYNVGQVVTDYYYNPATSQFTSVKPASNIGRADMKMVQLTVTWGAGQTFQVDEAQSGVSLDSGSITLTDMISSMTSPAGGKVVLNNTTASTVGPPVDYSPGQNPDIVSINLGANRFKESTTPLPTVYNANERVETKFDVVTYSQNDAGATFLRREEFLAVACECTLKFSTTNSEGGTRPAIWNGNDYTAGEFVAKAYGVSNRDNAANFQSQYCSVCCRDHHDGGIGTEDIGTDPGFSEFSPFRSSGDYWNSGDGVSALVGDHKHYGLGGVGLADSDGDLYVEACRLIRKDGFFRVAQDFRQEGLNAFPEDYLDETAEVTEYSDYVTDAIKLYVGSTGNNYENAPPTYTPAASMSPAVVFPASTAAEASVMVGSHIQQLRGRGIYVDYFTDELRVILDCLDNGGSGDFCGAPSANSALELIPFYDVQLTWLSRWTEVPANYPVEVTNDEAIQTGNTHDRGSASTSGGFGSSVIETRGHSGNLGLTGSDPIDPNYVSGLSAYSMHILAQNFNAPPPTVGDVVAGGITSTVGGVKASDVEISGQNGAVCNRTNIGYECTVTTSNATLKVMNYFKTSKTLRACSTALTIDSFGTSTSDAPGNWTVFLMPVSTALSNANIVIVEGSTCPV